MSTTAPECSALAERLREMKARTGLSLAALAERTPYSKSSWERYLNGKKPTPRQAVEALCLLAEEPSAQLLALWELADAEWSGRSARPAGPAVATAPGPAPAAMTPTATAPAASPASGPADPGGPGRGSPGRGSPGPGSPGPGSTGPGVPGPGASRPAPPVAGRARAGRRRVWWVVLGGGAAAAVTVAAVIAGVWAVVSARGRDTGRSPAAVSPALDPTPGCRGKTCEGESPEATACGQPGHMATLPEHRMRTGASVVIRYSKECAAAWGRIWHSEIGDTIEVSAPGGQPQRFEVTTGKDTRAYRFTPMIAVRDPAGLEICFTPGSTSTTRPRTECFHP